jgi:glutamyl-tRNA reductase
VNLLVVGLSHRSAPIDLLQRVSAASADIPALLDAVMQGPHVSEAVVLSTCNRFEVFAGVTGFHGAVEQVGEVIARRAGRPAAELSDDLYFHYDDEAVRHVYRVAAGLESMVVGESQILSQLKDAYSIACSADSAGRLMHDLMQNALHVGKRVHAETGIDRASRSVVSAAVELGLRRHGRSALGTALVVGTGVVAGLAVAELRGAGAAHIAVVGRDGGRAARLLERGAAEFVPFDRLAERIGEADLVVSATAAREPVITAAQVAGRRKPLLILDLAMPCDVEPRVAGLPGITLIDIGRLAAAAEPGRGGPAESTLGTEAAAAARIVASEVSCCHHWLHDTDIAPTVAALRVRADEIAAAELAQFARRRPELSDAQRADVARTLHRVVQRLLHQPTVRIRQRAGEPGGMRYAAALRELFGLEIETGPDD